MCWNRGTQDDYNAWEALGNPGWGWDGMLPYFKKSENYTPVYSEMIAQQYSINFNRDVHGFAGPVHVSYPKYFYNESVNFFEGLNYLGVPTAFDPQDGTTAGAAFVPTDLHPQNQTRSDARRSYYDPYATRENFHVITGQHVTQLLIEGRTYDPQASDPVSSGDLNGDGNSGEAGSNYTSTPSSAGGGLGVRQEAAAQLHITGVEVRIYLSGETWC